MTARLRGGLTGVAAALLVAAGSQAVSADGGRQVGGEPATRGPGPPPAAPRPLAPPTAATPVPDLTDVGPASGEPPDAAGVSYYGPARTRQREGRFGTSAVEGGILFEPSPPTVTEAVATAPYSQTPRLAAHPGARLVQIRVAYANLSGRPAAPLCLGGGSKLLDTARRAYDPILHLGSVRGNANVCTKVRPGGRGSVVLVFHLPDAARLERLVLWNGDIDLIGRSNVAFLP